jgi:uncharacterized RDD family membrane protein YckC
MTERFFILGPFFSLMPKLNLPKQPTFQGPAAIWKRIIAFAIDLIILDFVIGYPLQGAILGVLPQAGFMQSYQYVNANPQAAQALNLVMVVFGLLALLYFAILEYKLGQTVGKMFMNIRVKYDQRLSFFQAVIRSMEFLLIFPFILLWVIDPLFMAFNKDGRRLSEILSKTRTVEVYNL